MARLASAVKGGYFPLPETITHLIAGHISSPQGGRIEGKRETLASLRSGGRSWEVAQSDRLEVNIVGQTAVVTGRWRSKGINNGQPFDYAARFLSIWIWDDGRRQNIAYSATPFEAMPIDAAT